jgi:ATP/maltotriose-dependent transcriptional regulator MalT
MSPRHGKLKKSQYILFYIKRVPSDNIMVNRISGKPGTNKAARLPSPIVLLSKMKAPVVPGSLVPRQRLKNPLLHSSPPRLIFMEAAPGYGKTCTTMAWLQEAKSPACWLTLERKDNNEFLFWEYLMCACIQLFPCMKRITLNGQGYDTFINQLLNELAIACDGATDQRRTLVIDNFHHINRSELCQRFDHFLGHLPANLTLFVLSRRAVKIPHRTRLLANGELAQINTNALRLNADETRLFIQSFKDAGKYDTALSSVRDWPMGLKLACAEHNSIRTQDQTQKQLIQNYLIEETFADLTPEVKAIIGKTVGFTRLSAELIGTLDGVPDGLSGMALLKSSGIDFEPLEQGSLIQYPAIVRDAIIAHLALTNPAKHVENCKVAAECMEQHGYAFDAIELLATIEQWHEATRIIVRNSGQKIQSGDYEAVSKWLRLLPERWINHCPRTLYLLALTSAHIGTADPKALLSQLNRAESLLNGVIKAHSSKTVQALQQLAFDNEEQAQSLLKQVCELRKSLLEKRYLTDLIDPLSAREVEILGLISDGLRNKDIAEQLSIALSTVKAHIYNIFSKLQSRSRTEAVSRGRELGIL